MKKLKLISITFFLVLIGCNENQYIHDYNLIPLPNQIIIEEGKLELNSIQEIITSLDSPRLIKATNELKNVLSTISNESIKISSDINSSNISIHIKSNTSIEDKGESYNLSINRRGITLESPSEEGLYRGITSLKQIILISSRQNDTSIPFGDINDHASYSYRGAMLDVARHFFDTNDVKRYIDILSFYKINHLHLHLTDDQGWRIEIKKWSKLTTIGAEKEVGGTPGGFYTQEEYHDIVNYAHDHFITIVPEVDIPGHTNAALASYSELNCNGISPEIYTGIEVGFSSLCAQNDITYKFLENVIDEISAITPGPYFHVGGDESDVTSKEDFIQMMDSVVLYVKQNNKKPITWDNNTKTADIAQYWNNESKKNIIGKSKEIIYSPASHAYLDMKYDSLSPYGLNWAGYTSVKDAYEWDPKYFSESLNEINILGIEAPIWTETVSNFDELSYLVFPRILGHAEIGWTNSKLREWDKYKLRMNKHIIHLKSLGINLKD